MPTETMPKEASTQKETKRRVGYADYSEIPLEIQAKHKDVLEEMKAKGLNLDYKDAETQHFLHWEKDLSMYDMGELLGVSQKTVSKWMKKRGIDIRSRSEASVKATVKRASVLREQRFLPELERSKKASWLALLIDTEGSIGWTKKIDVDEGKSYRRVYPYRVPYISVGMMEEESKQTIDKAAHLINVTPRTVFHEKVGKPSRNFLVLTGGAITILRYIEPYLDKFKRMATLLETLFKHRTHIPIERFDRIIATLFGESISSKQANEIMLKMTEEEFNALIQKAEELTKEYLL